MERSCRICMGSEGYTPFKSFFDENHEFAKNLYQIAGIKVFEMSNNLPALICDQCEVNLEIAARVRKIALETEVYLKTMTSAADVELLSTIIYSKEDIAKFKVKEEPKDFEFDPAMIKVELMEDIFGRNNQETFDEPMTRFDSDFEWTMNESKPLPKIKITKVPKTPTETTPKVPKKRGPKTPRIKKEQRPLMACHLCGKLLKGPWNLRDHMLVHSDVRNFSCDLCGKLFKTSENLRVHKNSVHNDPKVKLYCDACGKDFKTKAHIRRHIRAIHLEKYKEVCDLCGKKLGTRYTLQTHLMIAHGTGEVEKKFECTTCNKKFFTKQKWKQHVETHGERPWPCELCGKAFTKRYRLGEHLKKVHHKNFEDIMKFSCTICLRAFDRASNLQEHMRTAHEVVFEGDV